MRKSCLYTILVLAIVMTGCDDSDKKTNNTSDPQAGIAPAVIPFAVVAAYPHDTTFFTEGLEFYKGQLFESSGGNKEASPYPSAVGIVNTGTGKVAIKIEIDNAKYFGEGITFFKDKLCWLTLVNGIGFVYDANSFQLLKTFKLPSKQGWGLTHDNEHLILSDGSNQLFLLQPDSLQVVKVISISDNNGPVANINELEYINGYLYANQWLTNYILKIDMATGKVVGRLDLTNLQQDAEKKLKVYRELN